MRVVRATKTQKQKPAERRPDEADRVRTWRMEQFHRMGFSYPQTLELAIAGVDWHRVDAMLAAGATHEQVMEVMV